MSEEKESKWSKPGRTAYRNPRIGVYANKVAYDGDVETINGKIIKKKGDSVMIQPMIHPIQGESKGDSGDSGQYYSDMVDLLNDRKVIRKIFSKQRINHASRFSERTEPHIRILRHLGEGGAVVFLIFGIWLTLNNAPWQLQVSAYSIMLSIMIGTDTLKMFARWWSRPTRALIVVLIGWWNITMYSTNNNFTKVAVGITLLFLFIIKTCNYRFLDAENWNYTEAVQHTLIHDPEANASKIWEDSGKREAWTLGRELGFPMDDLVNEGLAGPFVRLGINIVVKKMYALEREVKALEQYKLKYNLASQRLEQNNEYKELYEEEQRSKTEYRNLYLQSCQKNKNLNEEIAELKKVNEELLKEKPEEQQEEAEEVKLDYNEFKFLSQEKKDERLENARTLLLEKYGPGYGARQVQMEAGIPYKDACKLLNELGLNSKKAS